MNLRCASVSESLCGELEKGRCSECFVRRSLSVWLIVSVFSSQKSCQTGKISTAEAAVQSQTSQDASVQTDQSIDAAEAFQQDVQVDYTSLLLFLQKVEDVVIKELNKNWTSHAFDGFEVNWTDQNEAVS